MLRQQECGRRMLNAASSVATRVAGAGAGAQCELPSPPPPPLSGELQTQRRRPGRRGCRHHAVTAGLAAKPAGRDCSQRPAQCGPGPGPWSRGALLAAGGFRWAPAVGGRQQLATGDLALPRAGIEPCLGRPGPWHGRRQRRRSSLFRARTTPPGPARQHIITYITGAGPQATGGGPARRAARARSPRSSRARAASICPHRSRRRRTKLRGCGGFHAAVDFAGFAAGAAAAAAACSLGALAAGGTRPGVWPAPVLAAAGRAA